jgi:hypothetical protein
MLLKQAENNSVSFSYQAIKLNNKNLSAQQSLEFIMITELVGGPCLGCRLWQRAASVSSWTSELALSRTSLQIAAILNIFQENEFADE